MILDLGNTLYAGQQYVIDVGGSTFGWSWSTAGTFSPITRAGAGWTVDGLIADWSTLPALADWVYQGIKADWGALPMLADLTTDGQKADWTTIPTDTP